MEKIKNTRWQLRVTGDLEKYIREMANTEERSINKTVIWILEKYVKENPRPKKEIQTR